MNTEQERADFEAWLRVKPCGAAHDFAWEAWQARAALQSQPLTVDALAQEIRRVDGGHSLGAGALAEALMPFLASALQPQDREDAAQAEWMVDDGRAPWAINSLKDRIKEMRASEKRCRNAFRKDYMRVVSVYFADALGEAAEALEKRLYAIDHARRIEGDGE